MLSKCGGKLREGIVIVRIKTIKFYYETEDWNSFIKSKIQKWLSPSWIRIFIHNFNNNEDIKANFLTDLLCFSKMCKHPQQVLVLDSIPAQNALGWTLTILGIFVFHILKCVSRCPWVYCCALRSCLVLPLYCTRNKISLLKILLHYIPHS